MSHETLEINNTEVKIIKCETKDTIRANEQRNIGFEAVQEGSFELEGSQYSSNSTSHIIITCC